MIYNLIFIPSLILLFFTNPVKNLKKEIVTVSISGKSYIMEVSNTPYKMAKGLMFIDFNQKEGMVFLYKKPTIPSFYNVNVRFPLRVYWVKDGIVKDTSLFEKNSFTSHKPSTQIDTVIEIPLKEDFSNDPGELIGLKVAVDRPL